MKRFAIALVISLSLFISKPVLAQTNMDSQTGNEDLGPLGLLSPDVLPKIQQLAGILQQNISDGNLSDARIQRELQDGDLAMVIKGLGPEASRLLDDIRASLQAHHSEESLSLMLHMLMNSAQSPPVKPVE